MDSYLRRKSKVIDQEHVQHLVNKKSYIRNVQKEHHKASFSCQNAFGKDTSSWKIRKIRYGNSFNGYCFSCYEFGHKKLECKSYERRNSERFNHSMKCWRCNYYGHTTKYYHTMRCYTCNGLGHKAQECWNSGRKSIDMARVPIQEATRVWRRKSEEQKQKDCGSTTYVNHECSRHMTKNQINYLILTEKQRKEEIDNVECSKHVIEEFP